MATQRRGSTARIGGFTIERVDVANFGDINRYYTPGEISATGEIVLAGRTTIDFHTNLTNEEAGALLRLCDAINERMLRELAEGL